MSNGLIPQWRDISHPIVGVVHAPPLPGSPRYDGDLEAVRTHVLDDARALVAGGVDGLLLENFGDAPLYPERVPAHTVACLTELAVQVRRETELPLGINMLRNDGLSALAVAVAVGADYIRVNVLCGARVTDQGIIQGIAHDLLRERKRLGASDVKIFADVNVKHSAPLAPRPLGEEVEELIHRGGADAVIVSGSATGRAADLSEVREVRNAAGESPILVGSGVSAETIGALRPMCNGFIVGSSLKVDGVVTNPIDPDRVRRLMACVRNSPA
jgi:hypothetical protein